MPNHCSNALMTTNPDIIQVLRECDKNADENFIEALWPMPAGLKNIITGSRTMPDGTHVTRWREGADGETIAVDRAESAKLFANHGTDSWYDWANNNWGTKWGSYNSVYEFPADGVAVVRFDSAWAPPEPWLRKVVEDHPAGVAQLAYAEGGSAYFGKVVYVDGVLIEDETSQDFWLGEVDWDVIDDPLDGLTPACQTHIVSHGLHTGG